MRGILTREAYKFQSTLPARGATQWLLVHVKAYAISIHAPRTGSDSQEYVIPGTKGVISIHAPRTGSDLGGGKMMEQTENFNPRSPHGERRAQRLPPHVRRVFQSTLPARGATPSRQWSLARPDISIHAPRTGSDPELCRAAGTQGNFNPRSPHGERRFQIKQGYAPGKFQSTLPARGATVLTDGTRTVEIISIHAPRTGSDRF